MFKLATDLIILSASFASIFGAYLTLEPVTEIRSPWHWIFVGAALIGVFALVVWHIVVFWRSAPKVYRLGSKRIISYMCRWVGSGGRVVIFSRDMSWGNDLKVRSVLVKKAAQGDLTICLERAIPLTNDLKSAGATIVEYGYLGPVPRSRFTIVDFERDGARVAVGVTQNGRHVIQEFRSGADPFFAVAEDMVRFVIASEKQGKHVPTS